MVKDGKLEFIGVSRVHGEWFQSTLSIKLPVRKGCKIQRRHPSSGKKLGKFRIIKLDADDIAETASRHRTGKTALEEVVATPGTYNVIAFTCTNT